MGPQPLLEPPPHAPCRGMRPEALVTGSRPQSTGPLLVRFPKLTCECEDKLSRKHAGFISAKQRSQAPGRWAGRGRRQAPTGSPEQRLSESQHLVPSSMLTSVQPTQLAWRQGPGLGLAVTAPACLCSGIRNATSWLGGGLECGGGGPCLPLNWRLLARALQVAWACPERGVWGGGPAHCCTAFGAAGSTWTWTQRNYCRTTALRPEEGFLWVHGHSYKSLPLTKRPIQVTSPRQKNNTLTPS